MNNEKIFEETIRQTTEDLKKENTTISADAIGTDCASGWHGDRAVCT